MRRSALAGILADLRVFLIAEGTAQRLAPPLLNITSMSKPSMGHPSLVWRVVSEEKVSDDLEMQAKVLMSITVNIPDGEFQQDAMLDYVHCVRRAIQRFDTGIGGGVIEFQNIAHGIGKSKDDGNPLAVGILEYQFSYNEVSEAA